MKNVLITGGSGSFGNAFVRRLLATSHDGYRVIEPDVKRIVIYSRDEQKQEAMARELNATGDHPIMRFFVGDVRDVDRLTFAMHGIDTVIHAAALKIVPTAEYNPTECIATNITGAENVVKAAIRSNVKRVIALSTDKAVNPINLYGASKLAAEKIFVAANYLSAGSTLFSVVRYGNVVGSRGSVVPLFQKLTAEGKSLPITDARMTRFWITMNQAINLVMSARFIMKGREIFVPKIPSIKISDLALAMSDMPAHIVGIRPGEKLHECLLTEDESRTAWEGMDFFVIGGDNPCPEPKGLWERPPEGFRYTSDTNEKWLTVEELRRML